MIRTLSPVNNSPRILTAGLMLLSLLMLMALPAYAQGTGLSDATKNVGTNLHGSVKLIPMLSYVAGTFFTASGLLKLKDWINDGDRNPIVPAIARLVVAAFLILLPHMMRVSVGTLFGNTGGNLPVTVAPKLGAFEKHK